MHVAREEAEKEYNGSTNMGQSILKLQDLIISLRIYFQHGIQNVIMKTKFICKGVWKADEWGKV